MTKHETDLPEHHSSSSEQNSQPRYVVALPEYIGTQIDERIEQTQFETHEEYVVTALELLLESIDEERETAIESERTTDTAEVKSQLESLGYL